MVLGRWKSTSETTSPRPSRSIDRRCSSRLNLTVQTPRLVMKCYFIFLPEATRKARKEAFFF